LKLTLPEVAPAASRERPGHRDGLRRYRGQRNRGAPGTALGPQRGRLRLRVAQTQLPSGAGKPALRRSWLRITPEGA
jgi:hypothetical protein